MKVKVLKGYCSSKTINLISDILEDGFDFLTLLTPKSLEGSERNLNTYVN